MSIEVKLQDLIDAIRENTAAHQGKAAVKSTAKSDDDGEEKTSTKTTTTRSRASSKNTKSDDGDDDGEKKTTSKAKKPTREDLTAIMNKVKEDLGTPEAKAIIKKMGVERLAEIDDDDIEEAFKLAQSKLDKADKAGKDDGDDGL